MTDKEAMQMALETLDNMVKVDWREWDEFASVGDFVRWAKSRASFTAEALRARLAQPEQEPVKDWVTSHNEICVLLRQAHDALALTSYPPKRKWVGLTREELAEIAEFHFHGALSGREFYDDVEAKIKEKNNG